MTATTVVNQSKLDTTDTVYNFTVDEFHTYHIGELGVWVHNDCFDKINFSVNRLPNNLKNATNETLTWINKNNDSLRPPWLATGRGGKWGSEYKNSTGILPTVTKSGNKITYKEYDIQNVRDGLGAGTDRIVVGSDGRMYYTGTHYDSFGRIK